MSSQNLTREVFSSIVKKIDAAASNLFRVFPFPLRDGLAYGFIGKPQASLLSLLDRGLVVPISSFSSLLFRAKLSTERNWREADAISAIVGGVEVDIKVIRAPYDRQGAAKYHDDLYDVMVRVINAPLHVVESSPKFLIPEFLSADGGTNAKLVDGHSHRYENPDRHLSVTRGGEGAELLTTRLLDGVWRGGLSIRGVKQRANPSDTIRSVRTALARRVLAAVCPEVRIFAFQPDTYNPVVWHLEVDIDFALEQNLANLRFSLVLPEVENWAWRSHRTDSLVPESDGGFSVETRAGQFQVLLQWFGEKGLNATDMERHLAVAKGALLETIHRHIKKIKQV
ncbi:hypothetical protein [Herbaspirillum sp. RV1423]|uniref:hypothetical protein n=1 Tax=Herbaspirillum sp. RV1423 TaxID=1443993 RepID=UPI0004B8F6F9|nr:hypothetical protein [Herbaspirillum sp. RV1423]